jgi:site-specific DNA-cytosine methylase
VEIDPYACRTLRLNRPQWNVTEADVHHFDGRPYRGADQVSPKAGGRSSRLSAGLASAEM